MDIPSQPFSHHHFHALTHFAKWALLALILPITSAWANADDGEIKDDGTIDFQVQFTYPPTQEDVDRLASSFLQASRLFCDVTDGQLVFGDVTFQTSAADERSADVWILPRGAFHRLSNSGFLPDDGSRIYLSPNVVFNTIAHELGHGVLGLLDVYDEQNRFGRFDGIGWALGPGRCTRLGNLCSGDEECLAGERCDMDPALAPSGAQGTCSLDGNPCVSDASCAALLAQSCMDARVCSHSGDICQFPADCPTLPAQTCQTGHCDWDGAACASDADCAALSQTCDLDSGLSTCSASHEACTPASCSTPVTQTCHYAALSDRANTLMGAYREGYCFDRSTNDTGKSCKHGQYDPHDPHNQRCAAGEVCTNPVQRSEILAQGDFDKLTGDGLECPQPRSGHVLRLAGFFGWNVPIKGGDLPDDPTSFDQLNEASNGWLDRTYVDSLGVQARVNQESNRDLRIYGRKLGDELTPEYNEQVWELLFVMDDKHFEGGTEGDARILLRLEIRFDRSDPRVQPALMRPANSARPTPRRIFAYPIGRVCRDGTCSTLPTSVNGLDRILLPIHDLTPVCWDDIYDPSAVNPVCPEPADADLELDLEGLFLVAEHNPGSWYENSFHIRPYSAILTAQGHQQTGDCLRSRMKQAELGLTTIDTEEELEAYCGEDYPIGLSADSLCAQAWNSVTHRWESADPTVRALSNPHHIGAYDSEWERLARQYHYHAEFRCEGTSAEGQTIYGNRCHPGQGGCQVNQPCNCAGGQLCRSFKARAKDAFQAEIQPPAIIQADNSAECNNGVPTVDDLVDANTHIDTGELVGVDDLVLVLDHSGSMSTERSSIGVVKSRLEWAKGAARSVTALSAAYNDEHGPADQQRLGLVTFSTLADGSHVFASEDNVTQPDGSIERVRTVASLARLSAIEFLPLTKTSVTDFNRAFRDLEADGYTALEAGLDAAMGYFDDTSRNRAVLVLSDGFPNICGDQGTRCLPEEALEKADIKADELREAGIQVFAVPLADAENMGYLEVLFEDAPGEIYGAEDEQSLPVVLAEIFARLKGAAPLVPRTRFSVAPMVVVPYSHTPGTDPDESSEAGELPERFTLELPVEQGAHALTLLLTTRNEDPDTARFGFGLREPGSDQDDYGDLMSRDSLVRDPDGNYYMFLRIPHPAEGTWTLEVFDRGGFHPQHGHVLAWTDNPAPDCWAIADQWRISAPDQKVAIRTHATWMGPVAGVDYTARIRRPDGSVLVRKPRPLPDEPGALLLFDEYNSRGIYQVTVTCDAGEDAYYDLGRQIPGWEPSEGAPDLRAGMGSPHFSRTARADFMVSFGPTRGLTSEDDDWDDDSYTNSEEGVTCPDEGVCYPPDDAPDTDRDGVIDALDPDSDGDEEPDIFEPRAEAVGSDTEPRIDPDVDDDGSLDGADPAPFDPEVGGEEPVGAHPVATPCEESRELLQVTMEALADGRLYEAALALEQAFLLEIELFQHLAPWSPPAWALYHALLAEDEARLLIWYARSLPNDPFAGAWTARALWLLAQADYLKTGVCVAP